MSLLNRFAVVIVWATSCLIPNHILSQTTGAYTLKQAQDYALINNYRIKSAILEKEIAHHTVKVFKSIGFPFVATNGNFQSFIDRPTSIIPPGAFGPGTGDEPLEVQFGTNYNSSIGLTANQVIFDASYFVGLKAAKAFSTVSAQALVKTTIEIQTTVAQSYYAALAAHENILIFESNKQNLVKTLRETQARFQAGFMEEMDVEQLELLVSNIDNLLNSAHSQAEISLKLLKFQMGLDVKQSIELTDNLDILVASLESNIPGTEFSLESHIDYQLATTRVTLMNLNKKVEQSKFYPKLTGFFNYSQNAFRNEFNFFEGGKWYPTTLWGLNLSFPIFSGLGQHSVVKKAKLELEKAEIQKIQVSQALSLQEQTARVEYNTALESYQIRKKSLALAKTIQKKTTTKFTEGVASSMELTQAENQFFSAQGKYIQSIFKLLNTKATLDKALNKT